MRNLVRQHGQIIRQAEIEQARALLEHPDLEHLRASLVVAPPRRPRYLILFHSARDNRAVSGRRCIGPSPCELASGEGRGGVRVQHARHDQFVRITYRLLARRAQSSPMKQDKLGTGGNRG